MKDRPAMDQSGQTVHGAQTNIPGGVQGPIFSGQFSGPVAQGGDANDFRGATIYKPTYNYNFQKPEEISRLPFITDPPPNFTGRYEELKELKAQFDAGKTIIALHGFGGVGKTALSLKLVESIKDRYPDGQILVDMMGTTIPSLPWGRWALSSAPIIGKKRFRIAKPKPGKDTSKSSRTSAPCCFWITPWMISRS